MTETLANMYSSESTWHESYSLNTNMTGFRWFSKIVVLRTKVASALEGLIISQSLLFEVLIAFALSVL